MSGILGESRDAATPGASGETDSAAGPLPASVIVDDPHLSLWQRMVNAAEREFDKDDPPPGGLPQGGRNRNCR